MKNFGAFLLLNVVIAAGLSIAMVWTVGGLLSSRAASKPPVDLVCQDGSGEEVSRMERVGSGTYKAMHTEAWVLMGHGENHLYTLGTFLQVPGTICTLRQRTTP